MKQSLGYALLFSSMMIFLSACQGSERYRGEWKVTTTNEEQLNFHFLEKIIITEDAQGKTDTIGYTQNQVRINNSIRSYGIELDNGYRYLIVFPIKGDPDKAKITNESGTTLFTMGRKDFIDEKAFEKW